MEKGSYIKNLGPAEITSSVSLTIVVVDIQVSVVPSRESPLLRICARSDGVVGVSTLWFRFRTRLTSTAVGEVVVVGSG